jgi:hypothetical protein
MRTHMNKGSSPGNLFALHSFNPRNNPIFSSRSHGLASRNEGDVSTIDLPSPQGGPSRLISPLNCHPNDGKQPYGHQVRADLATHICGGRNGHASGHRGSRSSACGLSKNESVADEEEGVIRQTTDFLITVETRDEHNWYPWGE